MTFPGNPTRTGDAGRELIKSFEGLRLKAYKCPAGKWTIGYGSTTGVREGDEITEEEAEERLANSLQLYEAAVARAVDVPIRGYQFDALVSFVYNVGIRAFKGSTLLKKLNAGDDHGAAEEFLRWKYINGAPSNGLLRRRKAERELFQKGE